MRHCHTSSSPFSITVYCGAANKCHQKYKDAAHELGTFIGKNGWSLYFGAGKEGLMGIVSQSCLKAGGEAHGIGFKNDFINKTERPAHNLTTLSIEKTIHDRKKKLHTSSDLIVVLPGGVGTLDELMEALTWQYLGLITMPILIVNIAGYWDFLDKLLKHINKEHFLKDITRFHYQVTPSLEKAKAMIEHHALQYTSHP